MLELGTAFATDEADLFFNPLGPSDLHQAADLECRLRVRLVRIAADNDEIHADPVIVQQRGDAADHHVNALSRHHPAELQHNPRIARDIKASACFDRVDGP